MWEYLGLGISASWFINNIRYTNSYWIQNYIKWIFEYKEYKKLSAKEFLEEKIFLALRTNKWIKLNKSIEQLLDFQKILEYEKEKYLTIKNNTITLTNKWFNIYNYLITDILDI